MSSECKSFLVVKMPGYFDLENVKKDFVGYEIEQIYKKPQCDGCGEEFDVRSKVCPASQCRSYYCEDCKECNENHKDHICSSCNKKLSKSCLDSRCESKWCYDCNECNIGHYTFGKGGDIEKHDKEYPSMSSKIIVYLAKLNLGGYKVFKDKGRSDINLTHSNLKLIKKYKGNLVLKTSFEYLV